MHESMVGLAFGVDLSWPEALEIGMLVCFCVSWPVSIAKMLRSRRCEGKSLSFIMLVLAGYLLGIASKFAHASQAGDALPAVTLFYAVNSLCVALDGLLYVYFRRWPGHEAVASAELLARKRGPRDAAIGA